MNDEMYNFCIQNAMDLIDGKLSLDQIIKLRELGYSFDHYIDHVIEAFKKEEDHALQ